MVMGSKPEHDAAMRWARQEKLPEPTPQDRAAHFLRHDRWFYYRPTPPPDMKFLAGGARPPELRT